MAQLLDEVLEARAGKTVERVPAQVGEEPLLMMPR
jgi:hypothetical protein